MSIDLNALEAVALRATPGPWTEFDEEGEAYSCPPATGAFLVEYGADVDQMMRDVRYIAAFDPTTVLALIARIRGAEAVIEAASTAIGKVNEWDGHGRADQLDNTRAILSRYKTTKTENGSWNDG